MSTIHNDAMIPQGNNKPSKPLAVVDYNKNMGLVDKSDMQISFNDTTCHTIKWYKELFWRLVDVAINNAYILYKYLHQSNLQLSEFCLQLIKEICSKFPQKKQHKGLKHSFPQETDW